MACSCLSLALSTFSPSGTLSRAPRWASTQAVVWGESRDREEGVPPTPRPPSPCRLDSATSASVSCSFSSLMVLTCASLWLSLLSQLPRSLLTRARMALTSSCSCATCARSSSTSSLLECSAGAGLRLSSPALG